MTSRFLTIIISGATPNPCPNVAHRCTCPSNHIENPAVVLADTVDVIDPSLFDEPA